MVARAVLAARVQRRAARADFLRLHLTGRAGKASRELLRCPQRAMRNLAAALALVLLQPLLLVARAVHLCAAAAAAALVDHIVQHLLLSRAVQAVGLVHMLRAEAALLERMARPLRRVAQAVTQTPRGAVMAAGAVEQASRHRLAAATVATAELAVVVVGAAV